MREAREACDLSIDEISRTTKIPTRSLHFIEKGQFDKLPGDVFVRGFLRAYARCVELDPEDVISDYALCGLNPAPVSSAMADSILGKKSPKAAKKPTKKQEPQKAQQELGADGCEDAVEEDAGKGTEIETKRARIGIRDAFDLRGRYTRPAREDKVQSESVPRAITAEGSGPVSIAEIEAEAPVKRERIFVPPVFAHEEEANRRGPLTLAVIILVIVATLTMSYLLRRPGMSSDGFTMAPAAGDVQVELQGAVQIDGTSPSGPARLS